MASGVAAAIILVSLLILVLLPYLLDYVQETEWAAAVNAAARQLDAAYYSTAVSAEANNTSIILHSSSTITVTLLYVVVADGGVYAAGSAGLSGAPVSVAGVSGDCTVSDTSIVFGPGCTVVFNVDDPTRLPVAFVFNTGRIVSAG